MFYRFLMWILKKMIRKERMRQILVHGYTPTHDDQHVDANPNHLFDEALAHYQWGNFINGLALLQAQKEYYQRRTAKLRPDVSKVFPKQKK